MAVLGGMREVSSEDELRDVLGRPHGRAVTKERVRLHERDLEWIAASPFCLIATSAPDGSCDVSPKGDPPGFVKALDEATIAIPDRNGNRRADGFLNILRNPHVGVIFLVPGRNETLRVNGAARIVRDAPFFDDMIVKGHRPTLALVVDIEQIFFHCMKSFLRARLWQPDTWRPDALPSHAALVKSVQPTAESIEELERHYGPDYLKGLYG